jgi:hypothetical protein
MEQQQDDVDLDQADNAYASILELCEGLEQQGVPLEIVDGILLGVLAGRMQARNEVKEFKSLLRHAVRSMIDDTPQTIH